MSLGASYRLLSIFFATCLFAYQTPTAIVLSSLVLVFSLFGLKDYSIRDSYVIVIGVISISILISVFMKAVLYNELKESFKGFFYLFVFLISIYASYLYSLKLAGSELCLILKLLFISWTVVLFAIIFYGYQKGYNPVFEGVIPGVSTNGLPAFYLIISTAYISACYCFNGRLPIFPALTSLVVAYFGVGRGGILAALFLVSIVSLGCVLKSRKRSFGIMIFLLLMSLFFLNEIMSVLDYFVASTKLSVGFSDPARFKILSDYLASLDSISMLVGGKLEGSVAQGVYGGNFHIALLRAHNLFGFGYFVFVVLTPFLPLFFFGFTGKSIVFTCLLLVLWGRSLVEPNLFPTMYDFFYFVILFLSFRDRKVCGNVKKINS